MKLFPAVEDTLLGAAYAIRSGRQSCVQVVERCLAQIDALESDVRAWVSINREATLEVARQRDAELKAGHDRGLLHGLPLGIKDIVDVVGKVTGCGSSWMSKSAPKQRDAPLVTKLKDAGAILLGKTVTTQFACFDPPPTRNPWNLNRTPGGSSSGSAAAVASGMCLGAIGSQTGGSLTRPASFCGIATCKPRFNQVAAEGVFPLAPNMDHPGPMALTTYDVQLMMSVLRSHPSNYSIGISPSIMRPRIGRLRGFFEDLVDPRYQALLDETAKQLQAAGATVVDVPAPVDFVDVVRRHRIIMAAECAAIHRDFFEKHRSEYGTAIRTLIEEGQAARAVDYYVAREGQAQLMQTDAYLAATQLDGRPLDMWLTPATTGPAPDATTTGDPRLNSPWSYFGLATISFPIGLSADGMPLAVQFVGPTRDHSEATLIRSAMWCEDVVRRVHGVTALNGNT